MSETCSSDSSRALSLLCAKNNDAGVYNEAEPQVVMIPRRFSAVGDGAIVPGGVAISDIRTFSPISAAQGGYRLAMWPSPNPNP